MNVLLLCGYPDIDEQRSALSTVQGKLRIDRHIESLMKLGHQVTVVLAGDSAEKILVKSEQLINVELVFDTNGEKASLFTNIHAGLFSIDSFASVLPIDTDCPDKPMWNGLLQHLHSLGSNSPIHWVQSYKIQQNEAVPIFPCLVTHAGVHTIRDLAMFNKTTCQQLQQSAFPALDQNIRVIAPTGPGYSSVSQ